MRASALVYEEEFQNALCEVDNQTTVLMGHTRWRTRGDERNNANNHPICAGRIIGTHNGTLYNADFLFKLLRLPRHAEVDSELIFRLADRDAPHGVVDPERLGPALARCRGQLTAVLASREDPGTLFVLKGNKPLHLWYHHQHRVIVYASEERYLEDTLGDERGWRELAVEPMTMLTFHHADLQAVATRPLHFIAQERRGTLPAGVDA